MTGTLLDVRNVTKRFGDFAANEDVSLNIRPGEKHALLGENGAGKSTLVKMIYGVLQPSSGQLFWRDAPVVISSPAAARAMGIGMVFQHFSVFEALSVAENIALALPGTTPRQIANRIRTVSAEYGLALDPARMVHGLSVGERQRVEIVRCLLQEPRLLIMDEPTSVLTPQEAEILFATLDRLAGEGCAILYISHKLEEVRRLCDRATILRRGRVVATCDPRATSAREMAERMVGDDIAWVERTDTAEPGPVRLAVDHLSLTATEAFGRALDDISLEVHAGEVVGIAGIAGEGQTELMAALSGETRANRPEAIRIDGTPLGHRGPTARRLLGAAFVPEERHGHAAIADMTLSENVILSHHRAEGVARGGWIRFGMARHWAERIRAAFDVRSDAANPAAGALSGGNLQKFITGREILREPGVLVVSQPTWGVDAGAAALIRKALIDLARRGSAVLVISQDLEEIFSISDRIAVLHHGRLSPARDRARMTPERVGMLMGGAQPEAA